MITEQPRTSIIALTATREDGVIRQYLLHPDQGVFIGSSLQCGLQLHDDDLSGIHCRIGFEDEQLFIQNWMSAHGIQLNGQPLTSKMDLSPGDVVTMGRHRIDVAVQGSEEEISVGEHGHGGDNGSAAQQDDPAEAPVHTLDTEALLNRAAELIESPVEPEDQSSDALGEQESVLDEAECVLDETVCQDDVVEVEVESTQDDSSTGFATDVFDFDFDEEETYDAETVALLRAEIEELQSALAQRDSEAQSDVSFGEVDSIESDEEPTDSLRRRMDDLIEEANRSDERVALLEEMLQASEETNRWEQEERSQLEAWVTDIEKRIGQREEEHEAELDSLRARLETSDEQLVKLRAHLQKQAGGGAPPEQYEETLENLQTANRELQDKLAESEKQRRSYETQLERAESDQGEALREQRAALAKEQADSARLRFELSSKLAAIEEMPKEKNEVERETSEKIQALRQHLREIHEEEKQREREAPLTTRLARLWKRVEY